MFNINFSNMVVDLALKIKKEYTILDEILNDLNRLTVNSSLTFEYLLSTSKKFNETMKKLYFIVIEFLEKNKSFEVLNIYKKKYGCILEQNIKLIEYQQGVNYSNKTYFSSKLIHLKIILAPFNVQI